MDSVTAVVVEQIAQKLGVTAEYLWAALLRQAPISAAIDLLACSTLAVLAVLAMKKALAYEAKEWSDIPKEGSVFVAGLLCVFAFFACAIDLPLIFAGFFNPEFWALHQILPRK